MFFGLVIIGYYFYCIGSAAPAVLLSTNQEGVHFIPLEAYHTGQVTVAAAADKIKVSLPANRIRSHKNILWYTKIHINGQSFKVDVDTGSSDLFLPGIRCGTSCHGHRRYNPYQSLTSNNTHVPFTMAFADQTSVQGTIYTDNVALGGLVARQQRFGVGSIYSKGLNKHNFFPDGLLGLGFGALSKINTVPLLDTLYNQKQIKQRVFAILLDQDGVKKTRGELSLGGYNKQYINGPITYSNVTDQQFWQIQIDSISILNQFNQTTVLASQVNITMDTGSTLINANENFVSKLYKSIQGAKQMKNSLHWEIPCDRVPTLIVTIAGQPFSISPSTFAYISSQQEDSNTCVGGVVANVKDNEPWIVGGVFLTNVYTIFDLDQKRIGFSALH